jgi:hypothetical protein
MGNAMLEEQNVETEAKANNTSMAVIKEASIREERMAESYRKIEEIRAGIRKHQIAEFGRTLTFAELNATFEEWRAESRKNTESVLMTEVAKLLRGATASTMTELREKFGDDYIKDVEDFMETGQ